MKKIIAFIVVLAVYQHWGSIESAFSHSLSKQSLAIAQTNANNPNQKVILYGTSWCSYCQKTREFLAQNNIAYTEFDIEKSNEGRQRYDAINGSGVPVLEVNTTVIRGYAPEAILLALHDNTAVQVN